MKINEIMRTGPFTIGSTDCIGVAYSAMHRSHIRHLPVTSGGRLVGILSERDVLAARARADETPWWQIAVQDVMISPVQTAGPEDSVNEVAGRMAAARIGAMPVVERGKLLGIVTIPDVLDAEVRDSMAPVRPSDATAVDAMTPWPATIHPDAFLVDAVALMVERHIRHVPVIDEKSTLVGMLSERDVRTAVGDPAQYRDTHCTKSLAQYRVRDVMTSYVIAVPFDRPLVEVAKQFADEHIGAVPVVDGFGTLLGIVSYVDALRVLAR